MHPIVNREFTIDARALGSYQKPVSACFNGTIRPSQRRGVTINPNAAVSLCSDKAALFAKLRDLEIPTPKFEAASVFVEEAGFDYLNFNKAFGKSTCVLLHQSGRSVIRSYEDLLRALQNKFKFEESVFYAQNDDNCYGIEVVASRVQNIAYKEQRVDNLLSVDFGQFEPNSAVMNIVRAASMHLASQIEADFMRIMFEWGPSGAYVVNATTMPSEDTLEQLKAIIRRKVAMAK